MWYHCLSFLFCCALVAQLARASQCDPLGARQECGQLPEPDFQSAACLATILEHWMNLQALSASMRSVVLARAAAGCHFTQSSPMWICPGASPTMAGVAIMNWSGQSRQVRPPQVTLALSRSALHEALSPVTHMSCDSALTASAPAESGWQGLLRNLTSTQPELGTDIQSLAVKVHTAQPDIVRLTIADYEGQRWQVPQLQDVLWPDGDFGERLGPSGLHTPDPHAFGGAAQRGRCMGFEAAHKHVLLTDAPIVVLVHIAAHNEETHPPCTSAGSVATPGGASASCIINLQACLCLLLTAVSWQQAHSRPDLVLGLLQGCSANLPVPPASCMMFTTRAPPSPSLWGARATTAAPLLCLTLWETAWSSR